MGRDRTAGGRLRDRAGGGSTAKGGSKKTIEFAVKHKKPCIHIGRDSCEDPAQRLRGFVKEHGIRILNVAGSRESKEPGIYEWVGGVIEGDLFSGGPDLGAGDLPA